MKTKRKQRRSLPRLVSRTYTFQLYGKGRWMQQTYKSLRVAKRMILANLPHGYDGYELFCDTRTKISG